MRYLPKYYGVILHCSMPLFSPSPSNVSLPVLPLYCVSPSCLRCLRSLCHSLDYFLCYIPSWLRPLLISASFSLLPPLRFSSSGAVCAGSVLRDLPISQSALVSLLPSTIASRLTIEPRPSKYASRYEWSQFTTLQNKLNAVERNKFNGR